MIKIISAQIVAGKDDFFNYPSGIQWSHKDKVFYIADMHNKRVCWLSEDGRRGVLTSTVIGDKSCSSLGRPLAIWVTDQGLLFIADAEHNKIFFKTIQKDEAWRPIQLDPRFQFNLPGGVAVDENGNVYTNDFLHNRIVKIMPDGEAIILLQGVSKPYGIFYQKNRLYYTDTDNARICYIDVEEGKSYVLNPEVESKALCFPTALSLDKEGNIYVCDQRSIFFINIRGNTISPILDKKVWNEQLKRNLLHRICHIGALTVKSKKEIYWVDTIKNCVYKLMLEHL